MRRAENTDALGCRHEDEHLRFGRLLLISAESGKIIREGVRKMIDAVGVLLRDRRTPTGEEC